MSRGTTYRIALRSERCARVKLTGPVGPLGTLACNGYAPFTPGPDGGGRYVFEVIAPPGQRSATYRLQVARARVDDIGVGLELRNLRTARGALAPSALDVVDIYHFDVARRSDVRLRLQKPDRREFSMELMTDTGRTLRSGVEEISRRLDRERYIVVVGGKPGTAAGQYRLSLVVRQITKTTIALDDANAEDANNEIAPGASVTLRVETTPTPERGWTQLQIDRFDPLTGWEFNRTLRVRATGATVVWKPPLSGRWRMRATFLGTLLSSPSTSPYVRILVAVPLPEEDGPNSGS